MHFSQMHFSKVHFSKVHFSKMHFRKCIFRKCIFRKCIFRKFANCWRARSRLYQNEILQENMRLTAFFKLYKICIFLHRCYLKIFAKKSVWKNSNFREISAKNCKRRKNLQHFVKFQTFQFENLVDFEKCCKTHIFLQKSVPIQPKTSNILPKFCQKLATTLRVRCRFPTFPKKTVSGQPGHPPVHRPSARSPGIDRTHIRRDKERCFRKCIFRKCIFRKCIFRKFCKFLAGSFSAV